jgi:hypothetical protein
MRVQYARTYDELRELFKKNGIDIWQTMDEIEARLKELNIECDGRWGVLRKDDDERPPVTPEKLVHAMRTEELDAKDRLATTPFLEVADDARRGLFVDGMTIAKHVQSFLKVFLAEGITVVTPIEILRMTEGYGYQRREIRDELQRLSPQAAAVEIPKDQIAVLRNEDRPGCWTILSSSSYSAADDAEMVDAYTLWGDTGLPWSMLPQPTTMTRGEFNTYVENIKALRVEGHRGVQ